jgi:hypothetical protein
MEDDVASLAQTSSQNRKAVPTLSALEWKVVSLAMREAGEIGCVDGLSRSWIGRFVRRASGAAPKMPLADPRLETLRRFVCRVRGRADVSDLSNRLTEFGYSQNQISAVAMLAR